MKKVKIVKQKFDKNIVVDGKHYKEVNYKMTTKIDMFGKETFVITDTQIEDGRWFNINKIDFRY